MSYRIIEQHGGRIECDSAPDVGIEFVILLPRFTEEAVEITEPPGGPHTVVSEDRPRSILFIDDEAFVRAVGEGILKHHGYTVICATTDQEGMDYLGAHADEIDLIITNLTMPVMSGKEVLREARKRYPQIPVLVSSGYTVDPETFIAETGTRPEAVVTKPFSMEEMLRSVEACLARADAAGMAA